MAPTCFEKACELLARRAHFQRELERKLSQRGHDSEEIAAAVEKLTGLGYLDDAECARSLAAGPLARRGYGPLRMRAELERRGAPEAAAEEAVAAIFADGDEAAARLAAERFLARRAAADRAALARHLGRKGFHTGTVLTLARELLGEDEL
jgi:regulatory protein